MICLYHTNLSHEVPLSFVWLKFSSFARDIDMGRIRSDNTLSLGMGKATQGNIQGRSKQLSLGMPRKASPLSSSSIGNFSWSYVFIHHMISVLLGASCMIWVFSFSLPQSSLLYTPFERDTLDSEFVRILYVLHLYLLSYIVFALVLHLYLLEHGGGLFYRNYCSLMLHLDYFKSPTKQCGNLL